MYFNVFVVGNDYESMLTTKLGGVKVSCNHYSPAWTCFDGVI